MSPHSLSLNGFHHKTDGKNGLHENGNGHKTHGQLLKKILFGLLGGPGSGKDTLVENLTKLAPQENVTLTVFGVGSVVRKQIALQTPDGILFKKFSDEGGLIPHAMVKPHIGPGLIEAGQSGDVILANGFPRMPEQIEDFEKISDEQGWKRRLIHLFIDPAIAEEVLTDRAMKRREKAIAAGEEPRADDQKHIVIRRYREGEEASKPIVDHFGAIGEVTKIDALQMPDEVCADTMAELHALIRNGSVALQAQLS